MRPKEKHWQWVIWTKNRHGVRDLVGKPEETEEDCHVGEACTQDIETEDLPMTSIQNIKSVSDEDTRE